MEEPQQKALQQENIKAQAAQQTQAQEGCNNGLDQVEVQRERTQEELQLELESMDEEALDKAGYIKIDLSKLPRINWGALFMPAVWGPGHAQWLTILFYPIWIFADNCFVSAIEHGGIFIFLSVLVFIGTVAVTVMYARTAGQKAYLRVAHRMSMEQYLKRERVWTAVSILIAAVFLAFATWYNLIIVLPALPLQ